MDYNLKYWNKLLNINKLNDFLLFLVVTMKKYMFLSLLALAALWGNEMASIPPSFAQEELPKLKTPPADANSYIKDELEGNIIPEKIECDKKLSHKEHINRKDCIELETEALGKKKSKDGNLSKDKIH